MSHPYYNCASSSSMPSTLSNLEGQFEPNLEDWMFDSNPFPCAINPTSTMPTIRRGPSAGAYVHHHPYVRHPSNTDSGRCPTVVAPRPRVASALTGYEDNRYPTIMAEARIPPPHTGYVGNEYPAAVVPPRYEETGRPTIVAPRPRVPPTFTGYADDSYATAMATPPRVPPTLGRYEENWHPTAVALPPRVPPTHAVYCDNEYSIVLAPQPRVPPNQAGFRDNEYHATMALPPRVPPTYAGHGDNGYPTAVAPPSFAPTVTGYAGNGYLTAMSPPPRISKYGRLAMAPPVPQQQAPVAEQHGYGSQGVNPHAVNAWGHQQYNTVDGFVFSESINNQIVTGHVASSVLHGNADPVHMNLPHHGLMETTESPHPIETVSAYPPHLHMRHKMPHETAPAHPLTSFHTPTCPFTTPTCAPSYQEASGSAAQVSSVSSPTSPHIVAPRRTRSKPSSSGGSVKAAKVEAAMAAKVKVAEVKAAKAKAAKVKKAAKAKGIRFAHDEPPKFNRMKAPPEQVVERSEEGARKVIWEYKAITADLENDIAVDLRGYYYITTWDIYDDIINHFLRCEEKGCEYVRRHEFYHRCDTFRAHLRVHAVAGVIQQAGETKEGYEKRKKAAEDAKVREGKYVDMMKRFIRLNTMVVDAAIRRLNNNTLM